jgi:asparagine synthetase B (glutamine-hydrolysing)
LDDIEGMFAFALYDRALEKLYLVRDRIGEKPLYWFFEEGVLAFASEIKGLRAMLGPLGDIDPVSLGQYFRYGYVPDPRSIYKRCGSSRLDACWRSRLVMGEYLQQSIEEFEARHVRRYWSLVDVRATSLANPFQDRAEAVREIHQSLKQYRFQSVDCRCGCRGLSVWRHRFDPHGRNPSGSILGAGEQFYRGIRRSGVQ